jgi:hypothetical protein
VGDAVEQRRGHLGIAEHGRPFAEGEVRGDDDAGPLIKLADEVEQQLPSRAGERQITELVENDQVEPRQLRRQGPAFADPGLLFEACHQTTLTTARTDELAIIDQVLQGEIHLPPHACTVVQVQALPRLSNGKYDFKAMDGLAPSREKAPSFEAMFEGFNNEPFSLRKLTAFLGLASRRIAHHCADILLLDVAATSIFEIFEEFGTESPDRIGRETRFIDISTDSLSFVNASIALEGYLGFIPPRWDQLSLAELEELKHVAHV